MPADFDIKEALIVYQKIVERGEARKDRYYYKGLFASSDFDGYNLYITDDKVSLEIFFHNKYEFQFPNNFYKKEFLEKFHKISKSK